MNINENFISFSTEELVGRVIQSIRSLSPEHVIFFEKEAYYLFEEQNIPALLSELLRKAEKDAPLQSIIKEFFLDQVPAISQYELATNTQPKVVVLSGNEIIGFAIIDDARRKKRGGDERNDDPKEAELDERPGGPPGSPNKPDGDDETIGYPHEESSTPDPASLDIPYSV